MTYLDFKQRCESNHISVTSVCEEIGYTMSGLRKGFNENSLSMKAVLNICRLICVDPNYFCGWDSATGDTNYGNMQKGGKKNTITIGSSEELRKTIDMLELELKTKNEQIAKLIEKL